MSFRDSKILRAAVTHIFLTQLPNNLFTTQAEVESLLHFIVTPIINTGILRLCPPVKKNVGSVKEVSVVCDLPGVSDRLFIFRYLLRKTYRPQTNMPTYKLYYFNVTGLAEPIRYMFNYGGIQFEDIRFSSEDWLKYKADMPMGQVPVLDVDGKKYSQSKAIGRYVAKLCNLYCSDEIEALEMEGTIDTLDDIRQLISKYHWEEDPVIKERFKKTVFEKFPIFLNRLEEQVKKNGGHFVRGKLTWPDIVYAASINRVCEYAGKELKLDYPELKKLVAKVNAIPSIKAYLEKRPETIY